MADGAPVVGRDLDAVLFDVGGVLTIPDPVAPPSDLPLRERVTAFQRAAVLEALSRHGGGWAEAARELGMDRSNLFHLARRLGISRERAPAR